MSRPTAASLRTLVTLVRAEVLTTHRLDSCIASTRAFIDACALLGWKARPFPVVLEAYNAKLVALLDEWEAVGSSPEPPQGTLDAWAAAGGYVVIIGKTCEPGFAGHVVAVVEGRFLVDPSVDQASRPGKALHLTDPVVAPYQREGVLALKREDGIVLRYHPAPDNQRYLTSPDWTKRHRTAPSVCRAVVAFNERRTA